jgi:YesN/AraC family two-component response regulator
MKHKILLVDDERNILNSLKRELTNELYQVLTADNGYEALKILQENNIALIISDMRMPEMDGVTFLKQAEQINEKTVKIILSGYADSKTILAAINDGHIYRFIVKPWDRKELSVIVKQALEYYDLKNDKENLIIELNKKNEQLLKLNSNLDAIVANRTRELAAKDKILHYFLKLNPFKESLDFLLKTFFEVIPQDKIIFMKFNDSDNLQIIKSLLKENKVITDNTIQIKSLINTSVFKRFYSSNIFTNKNCQEEIKVQLEKINICNFIIIPVKNQHTSFGLLITSLPNEKNVNDEMIEKIRSFTLYLTMMLNDYSIVGDMDGLYKNVDNILKELQ